MSFYECKKCGGIPGVSACCADNVRASPQPTQQWQPIETAPQGQIALFYDAKATEVRNCMFVDWVVDGKFYGDRQRTATHWMPLPSPPTE